MYCFSASLSLTKKGVVSICKKKNRQYEELTELVEKLLDKIFSECQIINHFNLFGDVILTNKILGSLTGI